MDSENSDMFLGEGFFGRKSMIADNTSSKIDDEIIKISKISLNNSIKILNKNRILLDKLVDIILNSETIDKQLFKLTSSELLKVYLIVYFNNKKNFFLIIKNNTTKLIITLSFLLIIPFVQKQWFNLYLFNINNISIYSILYYISGTICPSLICLNSLNNFTYYKFNSNKIKSNKTLNGRGLLFLVALNLIILSFLITYYFYVNFDFISNLFLEGIKVPQFDLFQLFIIIFLIAILLIFKKCRILFKKLILVNFIFISFYIWYLQINNIYIDDKLQIYKFFSFNNINLINVFILITIEICYFTWSFLSYKTNLSDWIVQSPQKRDILPILKILLFYFFIIIYYSIL